MASCKSDIDYSSISFFKYDGNTWTQLATDISEEAETKNIGARCDYAGEGTYVLMAKSASSQTLQSLEAVSYQNSVDHDGVVTLSFSDPNPNTKYYRISYSNQPITTDNENVSTIIANAPTSGIVISYGIAEQTIYTVIVAVADDGAQSPEANLTVETALADSDQDGIPDQFCDRYDLWPKDGEVKDIANSDDDGDGVSNLEEYQNGTDPTHNDNETSPMFLVFVERGIGSGTYEENAQVSIQASEARENTHFKEWRGADTLSFIVGDKFSSSAVFEMPSQIVSLTAIYEETDKSGSAGEGVEWIIESNVLSLTGTGSIPDYDGTDGAPWYRYAEEITGLSISDGITGIGEYAFAELSNLTEASIPETVEQIHASAFQGCTALKSLTLPFIGTSRTATGADGVLGVLFGTVNEGGVTQYNRLEGGSYYGYSYTIPATLQKVTVTDATQIPFGAFHNCKFLNEIILNEGILTVSENAFRNCSGLTALAIPSTVTSIGKKALAECSALQTLTLPFVGTSSDATEDEGVLGVFFENAGTGVTQYYTQDGSSLSGRTYAIPETLQKVEITKASQISFGAFCNCSFLTEIVLNEGILSVAPYAFRNCASLTELTIPSTVTTVENKALAECSGLTSLTLPFVGKTKESDQSSDAVFGHLFAQDSNGTTQYVFPVETGIATQKFNIPSELTNVTLTGAAIIPYGAFSNCASIKQITLNAGVTSIGDYAFYNCGSLTDIYYQGSETAWNGITKGSNNGSIQSATVHFDGTQATSDEPSVTGSLSADGATLSYTAYNVPAGAALIAASYDGSGKLVDVRIISFDAAQAQVSGPVVGLTTGTGYRYCLYLTGGATFAPLCEGWSKDAAGE